MLFSLFLLYDPRRHKIWGIALTIWWGLVCVYLSVGIVNSLSTPTYPARSSPFDPWAAVSLTPFLAVVGGVWGIFWHTGRTPTSVAKLIFALPRRMMIGGLIIFFAAAILNGFFLFLDFLAIVLLFDGALQLRMPGKGRVLGVVGLGSCVAIGLLLPFVVQRWLPFASNYWPGLGGGIVAILIGIFLAGSGAVSTIRRENPTVKEIL